MYGASRNIEKLKILEQEGITILSLDVTVEESIQECVKTIIANEGRIDILINNAGYYNEPRKRDSFWGCL